MYNTLKNTIEKSDFKLGSMIDVITQMWWPIGKITQAQRDELIALAREKVNPESERPEMLEMVRSIAARVEKVEAWIAAHDAQDGTTGGEESTDYPAWEPWDGVTQRYQHGAIVSHMDKLWYNALENMINTWEPGTVGTERIWIEFTGTEGE